MNLAIIGAVITILYLLVVAKAPANIRQNRIIRLIGLSGLLIMVLSTLAFIIGGLFAIIIRVLAVAIILYLFYHNVYKGMIVNNQDTMEEEEMEFVDYSDIVDRNLEDEVTDYSNVRMPDERD